MSNVLDPAHVELHQVIPKAFDLECHLRTVEVDLVRVVELRDFIPSLREYRRGYWLPCDATSIFELIKGLSQIARTEDC